MLPDDVVPSRGRPLQPEPLAAPRNGAETEIGRVGDSPECKHMLVGHAEFERPGNGLGGKADPVELAELAFARPRQRGRPARSR